MNRWGNKENVVVFVFYLIKNCPWHDLTTTTHRVRAGGVRYGSQTPIFKARSSHDQNYDGRKEC